MPISLCKRVSPQRYVNRILVKRSHALWHLKREERKTGWFWSTLIGVTKTDLVFIVSLTSLNSHRVDVIVHRALLLREVRKNQESSVDCLFLQKNDRDPVSCSRFPYFLLVMSNSVKKGKREITWGFHWFKDKTQGFRDQPAFVRNSFTFGGSWSTFQGTDFLLPFGWLVHERV